MERIPKPARLPSDLGTLLAFDGSDAWSYNAFAHRVHAADMARSIGEAETLLAQRPTQPARRLRTV